MSTKNESLRTRVRKWVEAPLFVGFITALIILNAITLGIDTYRELPEEIHSVIRAIDTIVISVFVVELLLKIYAFGFRFFRSGWNVFDFIVVLISVMPGTGMFQVLRSLRVLRVLRLLHVVPMMKRIVEALFKALPGMGAILAVLALMVYVGAVMATHMFGNTETPEVAAMFGDLPSSAFTLFQVMTMDGWSDVVKAVVEDGNPYGWVFFMIFIFMASFAVLNLFIALIVEALQAEQEAHQDESLEHLEDAQERADRQRAELIQMVADLKREIASLKQDRADGSPSDGQKG